MAKSIPQQPLDFLSKPSSCACVGSAGSGDHRFDCLRPYVAKQHVQHVCMGGAAGRQQGVISSDAGKAIRHFATCTFLMWRASL